MIELGLLSGLAFMAYAVAVSNVRFNHSRHSFGMNETVSQARPKVRLFVEDDLGAGLLVDLNKDQSHKVAHVLRLKTGDTVGLFNGRDGEWSGRLQAVGKKRCAVKLEALHQPQTPVPDLWLVFAPIKRARLDFVAEKAAELGVSEIRPVVTRRTNVQRIKTERLAANAREAAEQCERLDVPGVAEAVSLQSLLDHWPGERHLMWCDEIGNAAAAVDVLDGLDAAARAAPWAVLIGPEGGFDEAERTAIAALPAAHPVSLGPRILRADTAAAAALSIWQAVLGDWRVTHS